MTPTKPYLIRAIREWAIDHNLTPQILVDASIEGVDVPQDYVKSGQIILNIGGRAVEMDRVDNDQLSFSARFDGVARLCTIPVEAVLAIYARENGQGIFFKEPHTPPEPDADSEVKSAKSAKSHLKLIK